MDRAEFLAARRHGIGGSDVAPILGLSKWATPLDVYLAKIGEAPEIEETEVMRWGNLLEPVVRDEYARRTGREVDVPVGPISNPKYPFAIANLDGLTRCGRVVEVKTARSGDGWGEEGSGQVPDAYALQVQHYLLVTGAEVADVAVLIGGSDFRIYTLEADHALHEMLVEAEAAFWTRVERREPPDPVSYEEAVRRFTKGTAGEVEADELLASEIAQLVRVRAEMKTLEEEESRVKAAIAMALGDRGDTLTYQGRVLATWKLAKGRKSFDAKRFEAEHPDLFSQYMRVGQPSRRLLIK